MVWFAWQLHGEAGFVHIILHKELSSRRESSPRPKPQSGAVQMKAMAAVNPPRRSAGEHADRAWSRATSSDGAAAIVLARLHILRGSDLNGDFVEVVMCLLLPVPRLNNWVKGSHDFTALHSFAASTQHI